VTVLSDQLQIARNYHQQVVEIMRDGASQLTHRVEFLVCQSTAFAWRRSAISSPRRRLASASSARSLDDQLLEIAIDAPGFLLRVTHAEQRMHHCD